MKFSSIPIAAGFAAYLIILTLTSHAPSKYYVRWSWGPYIIISVIVLAIFKGIHYAYYNSKKNVARKAALYLDTDSFIT